MFFILINFYFKSPSQNNLLKHVFQKHVSKAIPKKNQWVHKINYEVLTANFV